MQDFSSDDLKRLFRNGEDFNDLFEVFREAIDRQVSDVDTYRELFWNTRLKPEELLFFAKKLERVFPQLGFDVYIWLSRVMETKGPSIDTIELSFLCLKKASEFNRKASEPFISACNLFDPDLKIPSLESIASFLKEGIPEVEDPIVLYTRLSQLYSAMGNDEMSEFFGRKAHPTS